VASNLLKKEKKNEEIVSSQEDSIIVYVPFSGSPMPATSPAATAKFLPRLPCARRTLPSPARAICILNFFSVETVIRNFAWKNGF
jgi:hypothetical protein